MTELEIKIILVRHLLENSHNFVISSEFSFEFGKRRADLALLETNSLTAFEIKSSRDTINRLSYQINSYKKFFDFCFVVCEPNNLSEIRAALPKDIGILLADDKGITHIRKSKLIKRHDKSVIANSLNIKNLSRLSKNKKLKSKYELCKHVSKHYPLELLRKLSREYFNEKYSVTSILLKQETTKHLNSDDIYTITKKAPSLLKKK
ncbi:MmcB family DNA repair protein [uncultured Shewanella sp.]|uniref:MmcB family DNA repair protein n=1 Tax=uncultured Shewanella sp. TaxID=173975 RepID=UPI002601D6EC|nr:MmcB family DNA repair protein [uncultured Shewanella sp.]